MGRLADYIARLAQLVSDYSYPLLVEVDECFIRFFRTLFSLSCSGVGYRMNFGSEERRHFGDYMSIG